MWLLWLLLTPDAGTPPKAPDAAVVVEEKEDDADVVEALEFLEALELVEDLDLLMDET